MASVSHSITGDPAAGAALRALVERASSGDQFAWRDLVARFSGRVRAVTREHRLGEADAADVAQNTWMRLVEHLGRLRDPESVGAWLATTASRECLGVHRHNARIGGSPAELAERADEAPDHSYELIRRERIAALRTGVATLRPREQRLLGMLFDDQTMSYAEIAAALEMPIGSIGPNRARALGRLAAQVERLGMHASCVEDYAS